MTNINLETNQVSRRSLMYLIEEVALLAEPVQLAFLLLQTFLALQKYQTHGQSHCTDCTEIECPVAPGETINQTVNSK